MKWLVLLLVLQATSGQHDVSTPNSDGAVMMNMPQVTNLEVDCGKSGMDVRIEFSQPFDGIIFSKGYFNDPSCRYVSASSGKTSFNFDIPSEKCGTEMNSFDKSVELSSVIVIQNDENVQEIWDVARHITCSWIENYVKKVKFDPFAVGMLNAEEVVFEGGDKLDCWMDIQLGVYPDSTDINSIVKIGDPLSLLVFLRDKEEMFDISVKDCYAYGGSNYEDADTPKIQLTDENGCVLKEKLISDFYTLREEDVDGSVLVSFAKINAFKFPDVMDVYMSCNMEICKGECDKTCGITVTEAPHRSGSTLFGEPIYTEAPKKCLPGSTDPDCPSDSTSPYEECVEGSSDPECNTAKHSGSLNLDTSICAEGNNEENSNNPNCRKHVTESIPITTTQSTPKCYPGTNDPRCPKPTTKKAASIFYPEITTPKPFKCYPGSNDPRCPKPTFKPIIKCYPGSKDPSCNKDDTSSEECYPGSKNSKCSKLEDKPTRKCYPGTRDPRCPKKDTTKSICLPGSKDPKCVTTRPPRRGSALYPVTQTTRKTGKSLLDNVITTTKKPPSPVLKPQTSKTVKSSIRQNKSNPKPKPEPTGPARYHAFHSFHYDKGDGRRSKKRKGRSTNENIKLRETKKLKIGKGILVAQLEQKSRIITKREVNSNYRDHLVTEDNFTVMSPLRNFICMSSNIFMLGLAALIFLLFISTSTVVILLIRARGR